MRPLAERWFRAMGTDAHLVIVGPEAITLLRHALRRVRGLEAKWSRFVPTSEVSAVNAADGESVAVSADTIVLFERAIDAWELTGGAFDPTMGRQLAAAGYDRPFADIVIDPTASDDPTPVTGSGAGEIAVDHRRGAVRLPAGVAFDPGGIGKGLAADLVTSELIEAGAWGAMLNLGGDLAVRGLPPEGEEWVVAVREPTVAASTIATTRLVAGGLATSTTCRRRWVRGRRELHHILDARSGEVSDTDAVLATVIAGEAWWAEAAATALLSGRPTTLAQCATLRVLGDGSIERDRPFERYE